MYLIFLRVHFEDDNSHHEVHETSLPPGSPEGPQGSIDPITGIPIIDNYLRRLCNPRERREMSLEAMRIMAEAAQRESEFFEMNGHEEDE